MRKIIKTLLLSFVLLLTGAVFAACGGNAPKIEDIYVDIGTAEYITVKHKSAWDPSEELVIKAKLSDGTEKTVDGEDCEFDGINTNTLGLQEITVTYGAYETKVDIMVEKYIEEIFVKSGSIDTEVNHNAVLDTTNAKLTLKYSDGTYGEISTGFDVSTPDTTTVGEKELTITYDGLSCTHEYEVVRELQSISVSGAYARQIKWGETYNYAPVTILAKWSNSETPETILNIPENSITKINTNQKGEQKFTVTYGGKTAQSEPINVYTILSALEYKDGLAESVKYKANGEYFDDVVVEAVYNDSTRVEITLDADNIVFTNDIGESVQVTFQYSETGVEGRIEKTDTTTFKIYEEYESLKVVPTNPQTANYFLTGTEFVKGNFKYYPEYTKTTGEEITDLDKIIVSAVNDDNEQKYVNLSYTENSVTKTTRVNIFFVESWDDVPTVEISTIEFAGDYDTRVAHNSTYDYSNLKLVINYTNGMYKEIPYADFDTNDVAFTQASTATCGSTKFIAVYGGKTAESDTITVVRTFVGVSIKDGTSISGTRVLWGTETFLDNVVLVVEYSNGTQEVPANVSALGGAANLVKPTYDAGTHETVISITFSYTATDCFENTTKTCTMENVTIYEELVGFGCEGVEVFEIVYGDTTYNDLDDLGVYFYYTSGQKITPHKRSEDPTEDTVDGYKIANKVDIYTVGKQFITVGYYIAIPINADAGLYMFEQVYTWSVNVEVVDKVLGYNAMVGDKVVYHYNDATIPTQNENKVTVEVGSTFDGSSVVLVPQYLSGNIAVKNEFIIKGDEGFSVNASLDTSSVGEKQMTLTYAGNPYQISISVVEQDANYTIIGVNLPRPIQIFNDTKANGLNEYTSTESTEKKGFEDVTQTYVVGNNNAFKFEPVVLVRYDNDLVGSVANYTFTAVVEKKIDNGQFEVTNEVTYDGSKHTFNFADATKYQDTDGGRVVYKITVTPNGTDKSVELVLKVIDAYNIYTAEELAIVDNANQKINDTDATGKWTEYKAAYLEKTGVDLNTNINGVVLHDNITITKDHVPAIHFYTESELVPSDPDYDLALGSLKDEQHDQGLQYLYYRQVENGQDFVFEGNYFQIDLSKMPLMVRADGRVNTTRSAITTHTTVFAFNGTVSAVASTDEMADVYINNLALLGNAKKSENSALSGGILGIFSTCANMNIYNNLVQKFCIGYKFAVHGDAPSKYEKAVHNLVRTNIFDAYNTMIYLWGINNFNIDACHLIGAGGPVMICDHVGNDEYTSAGGFITNVHIDKNLAELNIDASETSIIESWVAGTEGWFETYSGSGALAQQIKSYSKLFEDEEFGKTLLRDFKMNLVAVFKSGSAEGLTTSLIRGSFEDSSVDYTFNIHNTDNYIHMAKEIGLYDLVKAGAIQQTYQGLLQARDAGKAELQGLSDEQIQAMAPSYFAANVENTDDFKNTVVGYIREYASQGVFLVTDSGAVGFPGTDGWYSDQMINGKPSDASLVKSSKKYMYVYLFNGMGAIIELEDKAQD